MSWEDFQSNILHSNERYFVRAVYELLRAGKNKAKLAKGSPVDIVINRPGGRKWAVCCFHSPPNDRLTTQVLDELFLFHKNYQFDRVIAFTMSEFISKAAEELNPDGPIRVMKRSDIKDLYLRLTERPRRDKAKPSEEGMQDDVQMAEPDEPAVALSKFCPQCGEENRDYANSCPNCGADLVRKE